MDALIKQLVSFLVTIGIGFAMGIIFDIYRVIRGLWQPKKIGTFIGDAIFWIVITVIVYTLLFWGNWGELRIYVFIGILSGIVIYVRLFSKKLLYWTRKLLVFLIKIFKKVIKIFMKPLFIMWKLLLVPVGMISICMAKLKREIHKKTIRIKKFFKKKDD